MDNPLKEDATTEIGVPEATLSSYGGNGEASPAQKNPWSSKSSYMLATLAVTLAIGAGAISMERNPDSAVLPAAIAAREADTAISEVELEAKAAYVVDLTNGKVLFAKNAEVQLPLASLTKLMLAAVVEESLPKNSTVTIPAQALQKDGGGLLKQGERWRLENLLAYTMVVSSNDGARALALEYEKTVDRNASFKAATTGASHSLAPAFIQAMNDIAKRLKLQQTYFLNESGIDEEGEVSGAYGSAKDMATLLGYLFKKAPGLLEKTKEPTLLFASEEFTHEGANTNTELEKLPQVLASKTGFTDLAGGNLAVIIDPGLNHPVAIVVLGSSKEGRFSDVEFLAWATVDTLGH